MMLSNLVTIQVIFANTAFSCTYHLWNSDYISSKQTKINACEPFHSKLNFKITNCIFNIIIYNIGSLRITSFLYYQVLLKISHQKQRRTRRGIFGIQTCPQHLSKITFINLLNHWLNCIIIIFFFLLPANKYNIICLIYILNPPSTLTNSCVHP